MGHALEPVVGVDPDSNGSDTLSSAAHAWRLVRSTRRPTSQRPPIRHHERRFGFACTTTHARTQVAEASAIRGRLRMGNSRVGRAERLRVTVPHFFCHDRLFRVCLLHLTEVNLTAAGMR